MEPRSINLVVDRLQVQVGGSVSVTVTTDPVLRKGPWVAVWDAEAQGNFEAARQFPLTTIDLEGLERAVFLMPENEGRIRWVAAEVPAGLVSIRVGLLPVEEGITATNRGAITRSSIARINEVWNANGFADEAVVQIQVLEPSHAVEVSMRSAFREADAQQALQTAIRASSAALSFGEYERFMDGLFTTGRVRQAVGWVANDRLRLPFPDADAYRQLKVATEVFMSVSVGTAMETEPPSWMTTYDDLDYLADRDVLDAEGRRYNRHVNGPQEILQNWHQLLSRGQRRSPTFEPSLLYLALVRNKLRGPGGTGPSPSDDVPYRFSETGPVPTRISADGEIQLLIQEKLTFPTFLELIWSYWHEEALLVQSMNAITWRFQNRRGGSEPDPLSLLEIDPLRPLNNFIWGYIQDEQHRLTLVRRAYEYDHHYGLSLLGKAVPRVRGADSRTRFLEAFHHLLYLCATFYKEEDDTTVIADGFPILNALKEVHLLLTQGAHNQYGDLPWTARQEMLMQQWLLARPEFREFLPRRIMVDYPEGWMDSVETMKTIQGWRTASVLHFRDLGVFGEQILLGIRFGAWPSEIESLVAANWARYWRPEIQGYVHAYRAATGVDLTERVDATLPSVLLQQRLQQQLPAGRRGPIVSRPVERQPLRLGRGDR
jgi:hypothetical protein